MRAKAVFQGKLKGSEIVFIQGAQVNALWGMSSRCIHI